jgi:putative membrane protein
VNRREEAEPVDASRRTRLANERTYLAWWRTGLTALAVSIGFGKLVPSLSGGANWPFAIAGVSFALVGTGFLGYGSYRYTVVERALDRGEFSRPDPRLVVGLTACGLALGVLTIVLLLATA